MDDRLVKNLRTGMLVASVAVVVLAVGIILLAMMTPGNWVEVHESEPIAIGMEGTNVRVKGTVEVDSNMPYALEGVDVSLVMVDRERGSRTTLYSESGIHVPPGRSTISIDSGISASTVMLMIRDRAVKDGAPLEMELDVDCRYMLGLAGFHLTSDILVPLTWTLFPEPTFPSRFACPGWRIGSCPMTGGYRYPAEGSPSIWPSSPTTAD